MCRKVNADFLEGTRQLINVDLTRTQLTMIYAQALAAFRNEVNRKSPPQFLYNRKNMQNVGDGHSLQQGTRWSRRSWGRLNQNKSGQIYSHKNGFAVCYPLKQATEDDIGDSLLDFIHDFGVPEHLTSDGASSQGGKNTKSMKGVRFHSIKHKTSGPRRFNENPVESAIREIKRRWYRMMDKKCIPMRLWDYVLVWICGTGNLTVSSSKDADGCTPIELMTGETPDIS